jgi:hypothetical protein
MGGTIGRNHARRKHSNIKSKRPCLFQGEERKEKLTAHAFPQKSQRQ